MSLSPSDAPLPKEPPPALDARAPRPKAVRLRRSAVTAVALGAAALLSGSLAWAFIVKPELRADARNRPSETRDTAAPGTVRAGEVITDQPGSYDRLLPPEDRLPKPRTLGAAEPPPDAAEPIAARPVRYARVSEPRYALPMHQPEPPRPPLTGAPSRDARTDAAASSLFFAASTRFSRSFLFPFNTG